MIPYGTRLGPYEIVSAVGAGGMGEVYAARDTRLDRSVAIKVLSPQFSGNSDFRLRFEREARIISGLNHPNICTLHDVGEATIDSSIRRTSRAKAPRSTTWSWNCARESPSPAAFRRGLFRSIRC